VLRAAGRLPGGRIRQRSAAVAVEGVRGAGNGICFNQSCTNATSLHACSPARQQMREYVAAGLEELDR
jgi:hypothetical protein